MGKQIEGITPLPFDGSKCYRKIILHNAAKQLVKLFSDFKDFVNKDENSLYYGTETEVHVLIPRIINTNKVYSVSTNVEPLMKQLKEKHDDKIEVEHEYGSWMLEFVPKNVFKSYLNINEIYDHFKYIIEKCVPEKPTINHEIILTGISILPHIGTLHYFVSELGSTVPMKNRSNANKMSHSKSFLDFTIANFLRYITITKSILERRKGKPHVSLPIFQDSKTKLNQYNLDHTGYGPSCCGLQCTFSTKNMDECRFLYDQMNVVSFFFQCISNSSPIINGKLTEWDGRWNLIEGILDDRSQREIKKIEKSRFSTISFYISNDKRNKKHYNDRKFTLNKKFRKLIKRMFKHQKSEFYKDTRLLNHYGYLFIREPLMLVKENIIKDRSDTTADFDIIQSTNWNNVRFKPPRSFDSHDGWLMEFRSMDLPITAKEKAAIVFFVTLFVRMILDKKLKVNFYIPISVADKNFHKGLLMNADINQKFYFRKYFSEYLHGEKVYEDEIVELTMQELLEGNDKFDGFKCLIKAFIDINKVNIDEDSKRLKYSIENRIWDVYNFYVARCKGELMSNARFLRYLVKTHPCYKHDSMVSDTIITSIIDRSLEIQRNDYEDVLLGNYLKDLNCTFENHK